MIPRLPLLLSCFGVFALSRGESAQQRPIGGGLAEAASQQSSSSSSPPPPYRHDLLSLHKALVSTESITGYEVRVGDVLTQYLADRGYVVKKQVVPPRPGKGKADGGHNDDAGDDPGRYNLVAWWGGEGKAGAGAGSGVGAGTSGGSDSWPTPRVIISAHMDTVPPFLPYHVDLSGSEGGVLGPNTTIRGRGSVDAKGSVAAQVAALEALRQEGHLSGRAGGDDSVDVMLVVVIGEEDGGDGMKAFSAAFSGNRHSSYSHSVETVIFGEPTENRLACGHKGILGCRVQARGRAGHSGYPWLSSSANERLMRGLLAVVDAAERGELDGVGGDAGDVTAAGGNPDGRSTVNVGVFHGGVAPNVIAAEAYADLVVRVAIGPQASGHLLVRERLERVLTGVDSEAFSVSCHSGYGVVDCNCNIDGFDKITVNYGTDVPNLAGNFTRYLYGPGSILVAHSDAEALTVGDLEEAVEGYKRLLLHALA